MSAIRQQIWEEMKTSKTYIICCRSYTSNMRKKNRRFQFIIILLTTLGAFGFFLNEWCAFASSLIPVFGELVKKLIPQMSQPEEELGKLDSIASEFEETLYELIPLWNRHEDGSVNDEQANIELPKIIKGQSDKKDIMNKLVRKISKKEELAYQEAADEFLTRNFYSYE
jgi:hypothetical protein